MSKPAAMRRRMTMMTNRSPRRPRRRWWPWSALWIFAAVGHALGNAPHQPTPSPAPAAGVIPQLAPTSLPVEQLLMGHASVETTAQYDHSSEEAKRTAAVSLIYTPYRQR
jgi:hypothetical protein